MPRAAPAPVLLRCPGSVFEGVYTFKPGADGVTHSASYEVQYGTRLFRARSVRRLLPAPKGKRRTQAVQETAGYRYDRSYNRLPAPLPPAVQALVEATFAAELAALPGVSRNARRVTMRQEGGDDGYCYAVRVDGRLKWDAGMTRSEATWRRNAEIALLDKQDAEALAARA